MPVFNIHKFSDNNPNIILNYPKIRVDSIQQIADNAKLNVVQCAFVGKSNEPNVIYSNNSTPYNFQSSKIYICGKLHDMEVDYDGELIIENTSITTEHTLFMVFPLKTDSTMVQNSIDTILSTKQTTSLAINNLIDNNSITCIVYTSRTQNKTSIVVVNTVPIKINTDLSKYSSSMKLFGVTPSEYNLVKVFLNNQEGFTSNQEGFYTDVSYNQNIVTANGTARFPLQPTDPNSGDYMECEMIDIDSDTATTYQVPVSSGAIIDKNNQDMISVLMQYILYFIIFLIMFFVSPPLYNFYKDRIWEKIPGLKDVDYNSRKTTSGWVLNYLVYLVYFMGCETVGDMSIVIIYGLIILSFFISGASVRSTDKETSNILYGIAIFIIISYILGVLSIRSKSLTHGITTDSLVLKDINNIASTAQKAVARLV